MSNFKEVQVEEGKSPELKVAGELKAGGDSSGAQDAACDGGSTEMATNNGDSGDSLTDSRKQETAELSRLQKPAAALDSSSSQPIDALVGIRDRMDNEKKRQVRLPHAELEMESNSIASLAKPVFILLFLLAVPWVLTSSVSDWSIPQRYRCNGLGDTAMHQGQFAKARTYFEAALAALKDAPANDPCTKMPDRKAYSFARLGAVDYVTNNLPQAAAQYDLAAKTASTALNQSEYEIDAATIQTQLGNPDQAESLISQALATLKGDQSAASRFNQGHAYMRLAVVHLKQGKYQQALNEALRAKTLLSGYDGVACVNNVTGDIYLAMGNRDKARLFYNYGSKDVAGYSDWWLRYLRKGDLSAFSSSSGEYSYYKPYYSAEFRARALDLYLRGDTAGARVFIDAARKISQMIDLGGSDEGPPVYTKDDLAKDQNTINSAGK
jgi:tetratricopeptide (TPR) repeat protein